MRRMIARASSWVICSATVRVCSARKRQCSGSQKRTFRKASHQLAGGEGHQPRRPPQPPLAWLLENTLVNYAFLNNRCVCWTTDVTGPEKYGAMGQTFHHTYAYDLRSCSSAPKICSVMPWTEKAPAELWPAQVSRAGSEAIRPFPLCTN